MQIALLAPAAGAAAGGEVSAYKVERLGEGMREVRKWKKEKKEKFTKRNAESI